MNNNVIMPVAFGEEIVSGKLNKSVNNVVKSAKYSPYERAKSGYRDLNAKQQQVIDDAENEIAELRKSGELTNEIQLLIKKAACRKIEEYSEYEDAQDANGYPTNYGYNFDVNRNIDKFIDGREDEINIPHYVVIDGVMIAPETYSPEELRRIVTRAKEKGKKIDWDDFDRKFTGREETSSWLDDVIEVISDAAKGKKVDWEDFYDNNAEYEVEKSIEQIEDLFTRINQRTGYDYRKSNMIHGDYSAIEMKYHNNTISDIGYLSGQLGLSYVIGVKSTEWIKLSEVGGIVGLGVTAVGFAVDNAYDDMFPNIPDGTYVLETVKYREDLGIAGSVMHTLYYIHGTDNSECEYFALWRQDEVKTVFDVTYETKVIAERTR